MVDVPPEYVLVGAYPREHNLFWFFILFVAIDAVRILYISDILVRSLYIIDIAYEGLTVHCHFFTILYRMLRVKAQDSPHVDNYASPPRHRIHGQDAYICAMTEIGRPQVSNRSV